MQFASIIVLEGGSFAGFGVLFRGNAEADIRRNLIRRGVIKVKPRSRTSGSRPQSISSSPTGDSVRSA